MAKKRKIVDDTLLHIAPIPRRDGHNEGRHAKYHPNHIPSWLVWGSLVPACPFCDERCVLVVPSGSLDKMGAQILKGRIKHDMLILECFPCGASCSFVDWIDPIDIDDMMEVAKGMAS